MKNTKLKNIVKQVLKEQSNIIPSYSSQNYPGTPTGPYPGNFNNIAWYQSWVGTDPNAFPSPQNHCNFLINRYNLWSNQINNVGSLYQNQLHWKLGVLHRVASNNSC